jgi:signal transduction histidine kinase/CheY-like chemotaxis protein
MDWHSDWYSRAHTNKVLVIDDEQGIIRLCQRLLERAQFQVRVVTDPKEGVAILEGEPVDLLLVDIRMPGLDGFQVIDLARHHQPELAVVIMTGYGTVETAIEALRRGADGLILKPFAGAELVQSVKRALQESRHKKDVVRLQTLRPLFTITESLFTETHPERLQELLLETVIGHLRCSFAGLYREEMGELRLVAGRGETAAPRAADSRVDDVQGSPRLDGSRRDGLTTDVPKADAAELKVARRAAAWGMPLCVNREGPGDADLQAVLVAGDRVSVMAAPIGMAAPANPTYAPLAGTWEEAPEKLAAARLEGRGKGGVLVAARKGGEVPFREADLEIFAILARQAGIALENAALHAELRATIRQVEQSQRALIRAEKVAISGRLTASIAHEINNPLQSVQNCLHLAGRKELAAKERQNYLEMAQAELDRLMHTVRQMLDYTRPAALERTPVEINELVRRVLALLERQLGDRGIQIDANLAPGLRTVWAVADQIQQVLLNLLLNSMEAAPKGKAGPVGGKVFIETGPWWGGKNAASEETAGGGLAVGEVADGIQVVVEDTGPGIDAEQRERLFEPFASSKEGGTGLGLAISYGIISAHGGSLDLIQGRGQGACFRVVLPAEPQPAQPVEPQAAQSSGEAG